tara:strand:- start:584 stop:1069 length:486 start_codon:yes stop_codon:yes gene_type:complete
MALSLIKASSIASGAGGKILKASVSEIATNSTRTSAQNFGDDLDFGSFTPSASSSTVLITGVAYFDFTYQSYTYYRWRINNVNYTTGNGTGTMCVYNGLSNNNASMIPCTIVTSVANTDGSAITVVCQGAGSSNNTLGINRTITDTYAGAKSSVMFIEVAS